MKQQSVLLLFQNEFYNVQPATKIFEYSMSGLITIATDTFENKINKWDNGILCDDTKKVSIIRYYYWKETL